MSHLSRRMPRGYIQPRRERYEIVQIKGKQTLSAYNKQCSLFYTGNDKLYRFRERRDSECSRFAADYLLTSRRYVNADANVSYTDSSGNTISGTIHHPGIAMRQADLDNMRDHVRAGDEPWNTAFNAFAGDPQSSKTPRIYYERE